MTAMARCHPGRRVWARGLCKPCADYADYRAALAELYERPVERPERRRPTGTGWPEVTP